MVTVAAAIITNEAGEILICRRGAGGACANLWEFPGGKLETGETPEACVVRECKEELNIDIQTQEIFARLVHRYPAEEIELIFFQAVIVAGVPERKVHQDMRWSCPAKLQSCSFCPADREVIQRLAARRA